MTDPFGTLSVRRFQTRTDSRLHVLLAASASLAAGAGADRVGLARLLVAGCPGRKARTRPGPGGRRGILEQAKALRAAGGGAELLAVLDGRPPQRQGVGALLAAAAACRSSAWLSDRGSRSAPSEVADLLASLRPRPVLPVWLRDRRAGKPR
ncbi:hypothetical protein [Paracoccus mutanolyticus]|uniref:hypothetical protein n=1 Tax=Paracoccus mutanolyticus TaxID=1499308 RepID=UPI0011AEA9EF|nr:hypothetical protein [Paracoccus mutanolyticus]